MAAPNNTDHRGYPEDPRRRRRPSRPEEESRGDRRAHEASRKESARRTARDAHEPRPANKKHHANTERTGRHHDDQAARRAPESGANARGAAPHRHTTAPREDTRAREASRRRPPAPSGTRPASADAHRQRAHAGAPASRHRLPEGAHHRLPENAERPAGNPGRTRRTDGGRQPRPARPPHTDARRAPAGHTHASASNGRGSATANRGAGSHRAAAPGSRPDRRPTAGTNQPGARQTATHRSAADASARTQNGTRRPGTRTPQPNAARPAGATAAAAGVAGAAAGVAGGIGNLWQRFTRLFRSSRPFAIAVVVVIVLAIAGIVDAVQNNDKIYANVSVGEVDLSGMTEDEATEALRSTYADRITGASIVIYSDQDTMDKANNGEDIENSEESEDLSTDQAAAQRTMWKTNASTLQARMEYSTLAHEAYEVGRDNGSIAGRLHALFFGENLTATVSENEKALSKLANSITRTLGEKRKNYGITVSDGTASVTEGHDGNQVDETWLADQLQQRFTDADNSAAGDSFVAQVDYAPVQVGQDQAQATADQVTAAIANGASFTFGDKTWTAKAAQVGNWVKARVEQDGDGWKLSPYLNQDKAKTTVLKHIQPKFSSDDAKVTFQKDDSGNVTVHTSATGDMPMISQALDSLQQALFGEGADTSQTPSIEVASTPIPDSMSVDEALDYGVVSVVSSYTTEYTADADARNHNIHLAADLLNNSIITADGGEWSFNDTAGECNAEKGFEGAGVIIDGETVDEIGGGICQVATTVFNCVYEGGYDVVTRHNHTLYIASYPDGRDAAVSWPDLDLVWDNDSSNDLLMRTSHTSTTVTVQLLGVSDGRTVSTQVGSWKKGEKAGKTVQTDDTLPSGYTYVKQYGSDGKSISVVRTVKDANGKVLHNDTFTSVYDARDEIDVKGTAG